MTSELWEGITVYSSTYSYRLGVVVVRVQGCLPYKTGTSTAGDQDTFGYSSLTHLFSKHRPQLQPHPPLRTLGPAKAG
ncbi:hypothetical protein E2C01_097102 [Portunus trituberculatus]|uniref:Uncharacterized protein n=1 Tax=Portunus trituberculatus TaxID=210409 RepID=A0A5B7K8N2_PORTR|nr:hypothetical protein [Portunus trituberculatus]